MDKYNYSIKLNNESLPLLKQNQARFLVYIIALYQIDFVP